MARLFKRHLEMYVQCRCTRDCHGEHHVRLINLWVRWERWSLHIARIFTFTFASSESRWTHCVYASLLKYTQAWEIVFDYTQTFGEYLISNMCLIIAWDFLPTSMRWSKRDDCRKPILWIGCESIIIISFYINIDHLWSFFIFPLSDCFFQTS